MKFNLLNHIALYLRTFSPHRRHRLHATPPLPHPDADESAAVTAVAPPATTFLPHLLPSPFSSPSQPPPPLLLGAPPPFPPVSGHRCRPPVAAAPHRPVSHPSTRPFPLPHLSQPIPPPEPSSDAPLSVAPVVDRRHGHTAGHRQRRHHHHLRSTSPLPSTLTPTPPLTELSLP